MARDNYRRGTGKGHRPGRRISVRGVRRDPPDLRKLAQALLALAQAQAEADAAAQSNTGSTTVAPRPGSESTSADPSEST
jgi:hypothetical protein